MATLLIFPKPVIDRAVDPVSGIPGKIKFLNLAAIRELLDEWDQEYRDAVRRRQPPPKALPEPPIDPVVEARIGQGLKDLVNHLKSGFSPGSV